MYFDVGSQTENRDDVYYTLEVILQRLPCPPQELCNSDIVWLLNIARLLANHIDPTIRPQMQEPILRHHSGSWTGPSDVPKKHKLVYGCQIDGIEPANKNNSKANPWKMTIQVPIGVIRDDTVITIPSVYQWTAASQSQVTTTTIKELNPEALRLSKLVAMHLQVQFNGYIGSLDTCKGYYSRALKKYRKDGNAATQPEHVFIYGPHIGYPMWYGPRHGHETHMNSMIDAAYGVVQLLTGRPGPIVLPSMSRKDWSPVLTTMLRTWETTLDTLETWTEGCRIADNVAMDLQEGIHNNAMPACERTDKSRHWHPCIACCKAFLCEQLTYNDNEQGCFCDNCNLDRILANHVDYIIPRARSEMGSRVTKRMKDLLQKEFSHVDSVSPTPDELFQMAQACVVSDLDDYRVSAKHKSKDKDQESFQDSYVDQILSTDAPTYVNWHGDRLQPKGITIDAIDPIHKVSYNGRIQTGYHVPGNLAVTSFSMNSIARTYPKSNYLALGQYRAAENLDQYESAIAISRNSHVNYVESGFGLRQASRIGFDIPENYEELKQKYRSGERLVNVQTHPSKLFRTTQNLRPLSEKPGRKVKNWNFIWNGVRQIAALHGLTSDSDHQLWCRFDKFSNMDIPFFFNQYSVVYLWDPYALMDMYCERLVRLRTECDRAFAEIYADNPDQRPSFPVEVLVLEHAQQWMLLIKENRAKFQKSVWPQKPPTCDSWGLPIFPTIGMPNSISFGKDTGGGTEMRHGFRDRWPTKHDAESWSREQSGIEIETFAKNFGRFSLSVEHTTQIEKQLDAIRALCGSQVTPIFPYTRGPILLPNPVLRTEINANDFEASTDQHLHQGETLTDFKAKAEHLQELDRLSRLRRRAALQKDQEFEKDVNAGRVVIVDDDPTCTRFSRKFITSPSAPIATPSAIQPTPTTHAFTALQSASTSPLGRNLGRPGNTCWWSVVIQLLHKIPAIRNCFLGSPVVLPLTGRGFLRGDKDGSKHCSLLSTMGDVFMELDSASATQVNPNLVEQAVGAYNGLRLPPIALGNFWDCAEFLGHILELSIAALDTSNSTVSFPSPP